MYKGNYSNSNNGDDNFEEEYIEDEYEQSNVNVKQDFWEAPKSQPPKTNNVP